MILNDLLKSVLYFCYLTISILKLTIHLFFGLIACSVFAQTNFQEHVLESGYLYRPETLHSADIDGDGFKDVLCGDGQSVSWYRNYGDGQFQDRGIIRDYYTGISDVKTADFDNDGDLDVVSTSGLGRSVVWNEHLENDQFSLSRLIDDYHQIYSIEVLDIDNDGDQDILAGSSSSNKIGWYKNLGDGYFTTFLTIDVFTDILDLKIKDLNNDGLVDFICFAANNSEVKQYRNMGNGTFISLGALSPTSLLNVNETVFTDADNDGDPDIVVDFNNSTWLYLNDGNGNFNSQTQIYSSVYCKSLVSADIDNDGDEDLVYCSVNSFGAAIPLGYLRNNNNGGPYTLASILDDGYFVNNVYVEDFDNDGLKDLCSSAIFENKIYWNKNLGPNPVQPGRFLFSEGKVISSKLLISINEIDCRDFDGDGDLDVLASSSEYQNNLAENDNGRIALYENEGNGQFSEQQFVVHETNKDAYSRFRFGDLDNDGDLDLVTYSENNKQIKWRSNNGAIPFITFPTAITVLGGEEVSDFDLGDIDQDGDLDVVCFVNYTFSEGSVNLIKWYENQGDGTFLPIQTISPITVIGGPKRLTLVDIDLDGKLDILYAITGSNMLQWYHNLGNGVYSNPMIINSNIPFVIDTQVADLDQDGDMDILAISRFTGKHVMHKQEAGLTFSPEIILDSNSVHYPEVGDLDADGIVDIVLGSSYELYWRRGLGGGAFAPKEKVSQSAFNTRWQEKIADLNQDGKQDIVFTNRDTGKLGWLENIGSTCLPITLVLDDTICMGSSYAFNGMNLTEQGTYTAFFLRQNLCDSIVILNLRLKTEGCTPIPCSELYISEYVHGTSSNRAIELYNPTNDPIDLDYYSLRIYSDGSTFYHYIPLTGTIAANSTFVIAHPSAAVGILNQANLTSSLLTFNGDDAIELIRNFSRVDLIGQIGVDPGTAWANGTSNSTNLKTLIRKSTVTSGYRINAFYQPSIHFTGFSQNTFSNLGQHTTFCQTLLCNTTSDIAVEICNGDNYFFDGQLRSQAGIYYDTLLNSVGCDSIIRLDLSINLTYHLVHEVICSNSFYPFNNNILQVPGIYFDTLPNILGCDSVVKLVLATNQVAGSTLNQTICAGESIVVNGNAYTTSVTGATEVFTGAGGYGCDSIVTINLQVLPQAVSTQNHVACGSFTWINGVTYTSSNNTASHTIPNGSTAGCDSTIYLNLIVHSPSTGIDTHTECQSYTWIDGITYTANNTTATHTISGGNSHNCDSLVTLNLTILPSSVGIDTRTECQSYTWLNGITYVASNNTASHTILGGSANGCDSIVTLNLTILPVVSTIDTYSDCNALTWIDGNTYNTSNTTATHLFANGAANGCDSIVTLHFTRLPTAQGIQVVHSCEPYTWIDGITYSTSNTTATYTFINGAANGCDSVAALHFTLFPTTQGTDVITACEPYTWIDGITYTSNNNSAIVTLENVNGCDSIVNLALTFEPLNTSITGSYNTLSADLSGVAYQWINCETGQLISDATNQTFVALELGDYAVILSTINCEDTSTCITVSELIGLDELSTKQVIYLYPNPAKDAATIVFSENQTAELLVFDHLGKVVYTTHFSEIKEYTFPTKDFAPGVYTVRLINSEFITILDLVKM